MILHTLAILVLKNERTRNLNLSSSVCNMTRVKFDFGSMVPVISSIVSIYTSCGQHPIENHAHKTCLTCFFILSITRSTNAEGHGRSVGAARSLTQARVSTCKSRPRCGVGAETDARMSDMSSFIFPCRIPIEVNMKYKHRDEQRFIRFGTTDANAGRALGASTLNLTYVAATAIHFSRSITILLTSSEDAYLDFDPYTESKRVRVVRAVLDRIRNSMKLLSSRNASRPFLSKTALVASPIVQDRLDSNV